MFALLPWLAVASWAGPAPCGPSSAFNEPAFAAAVGRARVLLDSEALEAFVVAARALEDRLPCLTFVPTPEAWAGHLVDVAVVAYFRGEDWQTPLATALRASPGIPRGVGPEHPIATWVPPTPITASVPVPNGAEAFVDGVAVPRLPGSGGLHLVQLRDAEGLRTALLRDDAVPKDWLQQPGADGYPFLVGISLIGGGGRVRQTVDPPGDFAPNFTAPTFGVGGLAQIWAGQQFAVHAELSAPFDLRGHATAGLRTGPVYAGVGVGAAWTTYRTNDDLQADTAEVNHPVFLVGPVVAAQVFVGEVDAGLVGGVVPGGEAWGLARGAYRLLEGPTQLRFGLSTGLRQRWLEQEGVSRGMSTASWLVAATVGASWGDPG